MSSGSTKNKSDDGAEKRKKMENRNHAPCFLTMFTEPSIRCSKSRDFRSIRLFTNALYAFDAVGQLPKDVASHVKY
jgi:hypothetical protein